MANICKIRNSGPSTSCTSIDNAMRLNDLKLINLTTYSNPPASAKRQCQFEIVLSNKTNVDLEQREYFILAVLTVLLINK